MPPATTPNDADNLLAAIRGQAARIHTAIPGRILSYDAVTQTATVQIAVQSRYRDAASEELVAYTPPPIANVPVLWPSGGSMSVTWPLAAGDPVLLLFAERSLDEWRTVAQDSHLPRDVRRHDIMDAIAIPGLRSPADPIPADGIDPTAMVLRGTIIKLGSNLATEAALKGTLFEAHLSGWLTGFTTFLTATASAGTAAQIAAAATAFGISNAIFVSLVNGGTHLSTKVKIE